MLNAGAEGPIGGVATNVLNPWPAYIRNDAVRAGEAKNIGQALRRIRERTEPAWLEPVDIDEFNYVINNGINNVIKSTRTRMARRSLEDREIRSLTKSGGGKSYSVTIPLEYVKKLSWRARQKLVVTLSRDKIIIKDWKG